MIPDHVVYTIVAFGLYVSAQLMPDPGMKLILLFLSLVFITRALLAALEKEDD